ncbi:aldo/keto reductase [Singulisphaera acidiphila]|uniref:Putative oxidoreductase of aldo/keto reductase family n=1 Tax=Singulisphaera acidiphila (strain ATCC BAA-1392 / DSM 18658 / VKM B-2454 / MOB10) TaxID=886293 RepID=L0DL21_SINAD|nr:aldo/keto reductase [Singulisphaera acidiphila]AGA29932.1 putative oxidoreductase of aldo/keto reductase family [Singulisphaera acidiphila DSM 18658]
MANQEATDAGRREFLKIGGLATAAALVPPSTVSAAQQPAADVPKPFPRRKLGKTGVDVTIINQGTWRASGTDRLIRQSYSEGVRCYDTAAAYGSEGNFKRWFAEKPEVRKEIFLVSKTMARNTKQFVDDLDKRLEATGTDHLDLYFWHAMGDHHEEVEFCKSKEFGDAIEAVKKSGKAKFVGFSTHNARRADYIRAAAEGGFIDVIMVQYSPFLDKESPLNKSLDAAHKAGIGLISMKQSAGQFGGARGLKTPLQEAVEKLAPVLKERNLTPFQGLLQAIWTDERIATVCTTMNNTDQLRDNLDAARRFETLKVTELEQLRAAALASAPTFCADCDGRCAEAAGTGARLGDLVRYLTYHEHHGYRSEARRHYRDLTDGERDWSAADLEAAQAACPSRLDFARLLPEVDRHLA